ncbi:MAG: hypothetical protein AVDCRST_MAG68-4366 [uncultured Gemmatimonadetes bacterium]|uniref:Uncharacterized protein n=1 Tax=uncultured Gemmatimonadota bacterium TaxID=203437 RepID=A0A6J4MNN0_9BACT|nr:MAG: hypothetical protein AVDCRST_MAG68-4366 [uncultured Gemmatimonadota bacterium]
MATVRLHVLDEPPAEGDRAVVKGDATPLMFGDGPVDIPCPGCGRALAQGIWASTLWDIVFECRCGTFCETQSAIGGLVTGICVYFECGIYRLRCTLEVPNRHGRIIGEPFRGAGPPSHSQVVR